MSLVNKRILVTRTRHQASELAGQLQAGGAITILIPTIEIIAPQSYGPLDAALSQFDTFDWVIFTSVNAVDVFSERRDRVLHSGTKDVRATGFPSMPAGRPKIAAIGPATARAVQQIGFHVDLVPPRYIAESLVEYLIPEAAGKRFLLIRASEARDILPEALTSAGAAVKIVDAYQSRIPIESSRALPQLFNSPSTYPDAITFTSASTVRNFVSLLEAANLSLPSAIVLASIGPITSQTLRDAGLAPSLEATEPTIPALVQTLIDFFAKSAT
jgi:uroporphyrinogen-III synthase